jgi:hypothetical protein
MSKAVARCYLRRHMGPIQRTCRCSGNSRDDRRIPQTRNRSFPANLPIVTRGGSSTAKTTLRPANRLHQVAFGCSLSWRCHSRLPGGKDGRHCGPFMISIGPPVAQGCPGVRGYGDGLRDCAARLSPSRSRLKKAQAWPGSRAAPCHPARQSARVRVFRGRLLSPLSPAGRHGGAAHRHSPTGLLPDVQSRPPDREPGGLGWVAGDLWRSAPALYRGDQRSVPLDGRSVPGSLWRGGHGRAAFVGGGALHRAHPVVAGFGEPCR